MRNFSGRVVWSDLKYVAKSIKHICYDIAQKHDPGLLELYRMYNVLIECKAKEIDSFYF